MDYVPEVTRQDVVRIVERDFSPGDIASLLRLLDEYSPAAGSEPHRVHLAILKLSAGDLRRLRSWLETARRDYRDVLAPAEYPEWCNLGFVGVDKLGPEAREALRERDWQQYTTWLGRLPRNVNSRL